MPLGWLTPQIHMTRIIVGGFMRKLETTVLSLVVLTIIFCFPCAIFAQVETGKISGHLTDQNGGIVPGATVVVKNLKTGEERTVTSSDEGLYLVTGLKASFYTITATGQGLNAVA